MAPATQVAHTLLNVSESQLFLDMEHLSFECADAGRCLCKTSAFCFHQAKFFVLRAAGILLRPSAAIISEHDIGAFADVSDCTTWRSLHMDSWICGGPGATC